MTLLGFGFLLISFVYMHSAIVVPQFVGEVGGGEGVGGGGGEIRLKLDIQSQAGGKILDVDEQRGCEVLKIKQFSWTPYVHRP